MIRTSIYIITVFISSFCYSFAAEPIMALQQDSLWRIIGDDGRQMMPTLDVDKVTGAGDGLITTLKMVDKYTPEWIIYDYSGKIIHRLRYDKVGRFTGNLAIIMNYRDDSHKVADFGIIDKSGKVVVEPKYNYSVVKQEGAYYFDGKDTHYLDSTGTKIIQLKGASGDIYSQGYTHAFCTNNRYAYYNMSGKRESECRYDECKPFSEGLAAILIDNKWGYIDRKFDTVIPVGFDQARPFQEGRAFVGKYDARYVTGWGIININGELIANFKYKYARDFSEGLAAVKFKEGWGYIDTDANWVIPNNFLVAGSFHNGLAWAISKDKRRGFIDKTGKFVIDIPKSDKYIDLRFTN